MPSRSARSSPPPGAFRGSRSCWSASRSTRAAPLRPGRSTPDERKRLLDLVKKSKGRPSNLTRPRARAGAGARRQGAHRAPATLTARARRWLLKRVIPCLDVDAGRVVKGTNFVDIRDAGDPVELAERYDAEGADELVFLDITASHEQRDTIVELARRTADNVFIPFTIGGGIRSVEDAQAVLDAGADKVSVNSSALARPGADRRAGRGLRLAVRRDRDRRQARRAERLGRLRQRRPRARRRPRGRRLGARGDGARGGGGAADEHGPRRHHRRLRARADPRGRRRGRRPGDRLGRRGRARAPLSRRSARAAPTPCSAPRSSTTASTRVREAKEHLRAAGIPVRL